jgi:hypothetical protein
MEQMEARLISFALTVRVIVPKDSSLTDIVEAAKAPAIRRVNEDLFENLTANLFDKEMPFDPVSLEVDWIAYIKLTRLIHKRDTYLVITDKQAEKWQDAKIVAVYQYNGSEMQREMDLTDAYALFKNKVMNNESITIYVVNDGNNMILNYKKQ